MNTIHLKRLNGVDFIKFIMAFAVVTLHVQPLFNVNYPASVNWFIRLAVPYFFIVSGFLTARRLTILDTNHDRIEYLKNRALRFGKMFLLWLLIYLPLSLMVFNYSDLNILSKCIEWYFIDILFNGESRLAWPLWYLYASMIAFFLLSVLSRYKYRRLTALLLAVFIISGWYVVPHLTLSPMMSYCAEGFFNRALRGFPYILAALLIFKYSDKLINLTFALIMLAISGLLFYFGNISYPFFGGCGLFVISYMIILPDNGIYKSLNAIGIWIYLTHMFNLMVIKELLMWANIPIDKYVLLFISFIFTFITSSVINRLSKANGFMWLKKLI